MKSIVLASVVTALLVFSGCSDKEPTVDTTKQEVNEVESVKTETLNSEQSTISSSSTESMSNLQGKLGSVYFGFDEFTINTAMQDKVSMNSSITKDASSEFNIKLEGNCDEWGSDEYNFALGLKRANAVKKGLVAAFNTSPEPLTNPIPDQSGITGKEVIILIPYIDVDGDPITFSITELDGDLLPGFIYWDSSTQSLIANAVVPYEEVLEITLNDGSASVSYQFNIFLLNCYNTCE